MTKTMRERLIMAADPHIGDIEQTTDNGRQWMIGQAVDAILAELREPDADTIKQGFLATASHDQSEDCLVAFFSMIDYVMSGK